MCVQTHGNINVWVQTLADINEYTNTCWYKCVYKHMVIYMCVQTHGNINVCTSSW